MLKDKRNSVVYLAGGCFWGLEKQFSLLNGVLKATSGYANGNERVIPDYKLVCQGETEYKETVKVEYDSEIISLEQILFVYFCYIDPTQKNRQGVDFGTQYQTGIYFTDKCAEQVINKIILIEREFVQKFYVEIEPINLFYPAEEYHQKYLDKNTNVSCHISINSMRLIKDIAQNLQEYTLPAKRVLQNAKLSL